MPRITQALFAAWQVYVTDFANSTDTSERCATTSATSIWTPSGYRHRLVTVTFLLGAARRMVARDPASADELLERAQSAAEQALGRSVHCLAEHPAPGSV
ncbi:two-component sensor histidine kinase [Streptomyces sp. SPB074]|nr:two-component sensor histidine kinase [Streptomyces sp. SPB074]